MDRPAERDAALAAPNLTAERLQDDGAQLVSAQIASELAHLHALERAAALSGGEGNLSAAIQASQARLVELVRAKHAAPRVSQRRRG